LISLLQKLIGEKWKIKYTTSKIDKRKYITANKDSISVRGLNHNYATFSVHAKAQNNIYYKIGEVHNSRPEELDELIRHNKETKSSEIIAHQFNKVSYKKFKDGSTIADRYVYERKITINNIWKIELVALEGHKISTNIDKPDTKIWFQLSCRGPQGVVFYILVDREDNKTTIFYPTNEAGIIPASAYNNIDFDDMNIDDLDFINTVINNYLRDAQG
jgi:hypothetical protein